MNSIQAQAVLATVPMPTLLAAYRTLTGNMATAVSRSQVIQALAHAVAAGALDVDSLRQTGVQAVRPQPGQADPRVEAALRADIASARADTEATAQRLSGRLDALSQDIGAVASVAGTTQGQITALSRAVTALGSELRAMDRADAAQVTAQVTAGIAAAMRPVLDAVRERPEIAAQVAQVAAGPTSSGTAAEIFGVDARNARGDQLSFDVYTHPDAPCIDSHHLWTERMVRYLALAQATGRNVWLGGPAGTGKTQTVSQFAARTGRLFRRYVFDRLATREDYLGAVGLQQGSTVFQQGPVLDAYTTPGAVCLLDEVGMGNASALSSLNGWLEPGARMAYADRVWHRAKGSMFFAADNSLTQGDPSGRYAGVGTMNVAFSDRFSFVVPMAYLDPDQEADAITRHTGCSVALARHVVDALAVCRSKVDAGEVIDAPSIRQAIAFVEALAFLPAAEAWQLTVLSRQPAESSVALAAVFASSINTALIAREL